MENRPEPATDPNGKWRWNWTVMNLLEIASICLQNADEMVLAYRHRYAAGAIVPNLAGDEEFSEFVAAVQDYLDEVTRALQGAKPILCMGDPSWDGAAPEERDHQSEMVPF